VAYAWSFVMSCRRFAGVPVTMDRGSSAFDALYGCAVCPVTAGGGGEGWLFRASIPCSAVGLLIGCSTRAARLCVYDH